MLALHDVGHSIKHAFSEEKKKKKTVAAKKKKKKQKQLLLKKQKTKDPVEMYRHNCQ